MARWLHEGWRVAIDDDYAHVTQLSPAVQGFWGEDFGPLLTQPHMAEIRDGLLRLYPNSLWTGIVGADELGEELKVEVVAVNTSPAGLNLAIALSGDVWSGYRLRLVGYEDILLESTIAGSWEVLHRCTLSLDPRASEYHIVFWRSGNVFYAEVDGLRVLEYQEPFCPEGPEHRRFAIARFHGHGSADLRALRVCSRISPRYVDILEPGRLLLRLGHQQEAAAWFQRVAGEHPEAPVHQEAVYLAALATPMMPRARKEAAFQQAITEPDTPFQARVLRQWAFARVGWGDIDGAVAMALDCVRRYPGEHTPDILAEKIIAGMRQWSLPEIERQLTVLARLPLTHLHLCTIPLQSLAPLRGLSLQELRCGETTVSDLSPLQGMPMERLSFLRSAISDLTPLTGMPLQELSCTNSRLTDLAPLHGMPLTSLSCADNAIADLSPLRGLPLVALHCDNNRIDDLAPLRGMPLHTLYCSSNAVHDLTPLRGMHLTLCYCVFNALRDLAPLEGMPLQKLLCAGNRITDLSPLRAMPLTVLGCLGNAITDLSPLARASPGNVVLRRQSGDVAASIARHATRDPRHHGYPADAGERAGAAGVAVTGTHLRPHRRRVGAAALAPDPAAVVAPCARRELPHGETGGVDPRADANMRTTGTAQDCRGNTPASRVLTSAQ